VKFTDLKAAKLKEPQRNTILTVQAYLRGASLHSLYV